MLSHSAAKSHQPITRKYLPLLWAKTPSWPQNRLENASKGWKQEFFLTLILSAITPNKDKMKQNCFQILKKFMVVHYKNYKLMSDVTF